MNWRQYSLGLREPGTAARIQCTNICRSADLTLVVSGLRPAIERPPFSGRRLFHALTQRHVNRTKWKTRLAGIEAIGVEPEYHIRMWDNGSTFSRKPCE
jgi:hypothetical protein